MPLSEYEKAIRYRDLDPETVEFITDDLKEFAGYYKSYAPNVSSEMLRDHNAKRSIVNHVERYLHLTAEQVSALPGSPAQQKKE